LQGLDFRFDRASALALHSRNDVRRIDPTIR